MIIHAAIRVDEIDYRARRPEWIGKVGHIWDHELLEINHVRNEHEIYEEECDNRYVQRSILEWDRLVFHCCPRHTIESVPT